MAGPVPEQPEGQAAGAGWVPAALFEEHEAFFTLDPRWRFASLNRRAEQLLDCRREAALGQVAWEACPRLAGTFEHQLRRAARDQERVSFESFSPATAAWLEVAAHPWQGGLAVSLRDVTERIRRERRDLYFRVASAAVADAPGLGAAMTAYARGVAALVGASYAETWASAPDGTLSCQEVVRFDRPGHAEFERLSRSLVLAPGMSLVWSAVATQVPVLEPRLDTLASPRAAAGAAAGFRSGVAIPVNVGGRTHGVVTFFSDRGEDDDWFRVLQEHRQLDLLFERVHALEALRRSEARHRLMFEDSPAPMWIYDLETLRFLEVNQRAIELYGFSREEFLAMTIEEIRPPEELPRLRANRDRGSSGVWRSGSWLHRKKDGTPLPVNVAAHALTLEGRAVKVVVITDLTEQKALEARVLRAQRLDSIGTLAGGLAHDLNNTLTPILLSVSVLREAPLEERDRAVLDGIETAVQRGAGMVRQVLLFARGERGERLRLAPASLLEETARFAAHTMPKAIEVRVVAPADLPDLEGDPTQLQQVLINLAVNARDAMREGGVLTLRAGTALLDAASVAGNPRARPGLHLVLEVSDTGTGIAPAIRERIFDPFFTTKEVGRGTGLGLASSLAIATSHRGVLLVESEVGRGSTFRLCLPALAPAPGAQRAGAGPAPVPAARGQLVLVVDDEAAIRAMACRHLEAGGYRTLQAANGAEALALFSAAPEPVALVLLDLSMPVLGGVPTLRALRRLEAGRAVPVIASSGLGAAGAFAELDGPGPVRFLEKPYTALALRTLAHQLTAGEAGASLPG